jgi:hypothetical protein
VVRAVQEIVEAIAVGTGAAVAAATVVVAAVDIAVAERSSFDAKSTRLRPRT